MGYVYQRKCRKCGYPISGTQEFIYNGLCKKCYYAQSY